jgi:hypothetical protein
VKRKKIMSTIAIKKVKKTVSKKKASSVSKVKDFSSDPFFVKKAKAAESFLKKHGLPPSYLK